MDIAYDHIQEEILKEDSSTDSAGQERVRASSDLNTEFRESFKAVSETSWGVTLGGLWGRAKKQGESYYESASKELTSATQASKGFIDPTSLTGPPKDATDEERDATARVKAAAPQHVPESLTDDIVKEARSLFVSFRTEASTGVKQLQNSASLKQFQAAEDAADEALSKFGSTLKNYLRDAVTITAPDGRDGDVKSVLFESKDHEGRRVVHATRFDAQLHVIHSRPANFTQDPESDEYVNWKESFDVEKKTDAIATDLEKYDELRRVMEACVPEKVAYAPFWTRYYFLRHVIEVEEQRRRELLAQTADEEVAWDDDDEDEEGTTTPHGEDLKLKGTPKDDGMNTRAGQSLKPPLAKRNSNDHSVADSDMSYDIVSGQVSGQGSPKESAKKFGGKGNESEEEDWE